MSWINTFKKVDQQLYASVVAHEQWNDRLREAIDTGRSEWTPDFVRACDNCDLGKWLDSVPAADRGAEYAEIHDLHARFHVEAAAILDLALAGDKPAANAAIGAGSAFAALSGGLIAGLNAWRAALKSQG